MAGKAHLGNEMLNFIAPENSSKVCQRDTDFIVNTRLYDLGAHSERAGQTSGPRSSSGEQVLSCRPWTAPSLTTPAGTQTQTISGPRFVQRPKSSSALSRDPPARTPLPLSHGYPRVIRDDPASPSSIVNTIVAGLKRCTLPSKRKQSDVSAMGAPDACLVSLTDHAALSPWQREAKKPAFKLQWDRTRPAAMEVSGEPCIVGPSIRRPWSPISPARLSFRDSSSSICSRQAIQVDEVITSTQPLRAFNTAACDQALSLPEVVECIISHLDAMHCATQSVNARRRAQASSMKNDETSVDTASRAKTESTAKGTVYSCMHVSWLWHDAARRVISRRIEFESVEKLGSYCTSPAARDGLCRDLLLHKVTAATDEHLMALVQPRLHSLELYVCPTLLPPMALLQSGTLVKLALPGCALADDDLLARVAQLCPRLEILDLRACERVSDVGVTAIASSCPGLRYLNVGRMNGGGRITDLTLDVVCRSTQIETVGLAGCNVSDTGVASIARYRLHGISRISMNQCPRVSDFSVVPLVRAAARLKVLELVGCPRVTDYEALLDFKQRSSSLIDVDKPLQERMAQLQLYRLRSRCSAAARAMAEVTESSVVAPQCLISAAA
ncbi:Antagonist of MEN (Mitotic Exit Network) [Savitreella phatthalungensis]